MSVNSDPVPDTNMGVESFPELDSSQLLASASTSASTSTTQPATDHVRRGRARSHTVVSGQNPLECPVTPQEQQLANLARTINRSRRITAPPPALPTLLERTPPRALERVEGSPAGSVTPTNSPTGSATPTNAGSLSTNDESSDVKAATPIKTSTEESTDPFRSPNSSEGSSTSPSNFPFRCPGRVDYQTTSQIGSPSANDSEATAPIRTAPEATEDPFRSPASSQASSPSPLNSAVRCPRRIDFTNFSRPRSLAQASHDSCDNEAQSPAQPSTEVATTPRRSRALSTGSDPFTSPIRSPGSVDSPGTSRYRSLSLTSPRRAVTHLRPVAPPIWPTADDLWSNRPSRLSTLERQSTDPHVRRVDIPLPPPYIFASLQGQKMQSYQSYLDSPQGGPSPNPRQAPPSPSPVMHQNGMNGGMALAGGMVGFPTPAGHQSDLNYIMQMVEELAGQLAHNQGLTAGIVDKMGKVRAKAKNLDLSNDEILAIAATELNDTSENLEKENSELRKALEKALYEKKENWKLAIHGANILSDILDKMHKFKSQHEADTLAWHRNYRKQLADEREENVNLRNQINDMKAAACRANEHLRQMRRFVTDHDELNELRVENTSLRQQRRMWKRMALPQIPADDSEWSDDDDLIDPEEKKRVAAEKEEKERKDKEGGDGGDAQGPGA